MLIYLNLQNNIGDIKMTQKKTKSQVLKRNDQIVAEYIPKYLDELKENNAVLQQELVKWESIVPGINNPYNMQQHIQKLYAELEAWRNLIPNKHTVKLAQQHLNRTQHNAEDKKVEKAPELNTEDMDFYNTIFLQHYGQRYDLKAFGNVESFNAAKQNAITVIMDDNMDPFTKTINDPYYFIKYFELKKQRGIFDNDFNVDDIEKYTKW